MFRTDKMIRKVFVVIIEGLNFAAREWTHKQHASSVNGVATVHLNAWLQLITPVCLRGELVSLALCRRHPGCQTVLVDYSRSLVSEAPMNRSNQTSFCERTQSNTILLDDRCHDLTLLCQEMKINHAIVTNRRLLIIWEQDETTVTQQALLCCFSSEVLAHVKGLLALQGYRANYRLKGQSGQSTLLFQVQHSCETVSSCCGPTCNMKENVSETTKRQLNTWGSLRGEVMWSVILSGCPAWFERVCRDRSLLPRTHVKPDHSESCVNISGSRPPL